MKRTMYILVLFLCACCVLTAGKKKEKKPVEITRMECYSVAWNASTYHRQYPADITERHPRLYDKVSVSEYSYLRDLQTYIGNLKVSPKSDCIDARIVCLLYKSNKTIDTLSFGSYDCCVYNGKCYYLTWELFSHILKKVPHEQYEEVNWHFQDDLELKARLEERDK